MNAPTPPTPPATPTARDSSAAPTGRPAASPLDLLGVGIGPFNLSLAALADAVPGLTTAFYDQRPGFHWHPGLLIDGATLQVPFLADLVTLADPTSRWSFLNWLRTRQRLYPFYFAERFHVHRAEYDAYCRWVAEGLPTTHFGQQVDTVRWNPGRALFEIDHTHLDAQGEAEALGRTHARHLVLGIGTEPHVPEPLRPLAEAPAVPVVHSAHYLEQRERLLAADHVTVVGSGQSGAEIFLDLLRARPAGRERLTWLARTPAFAPMEYSKLGLEHFTPDYTRYFHGLDEDVRDRLVAYQWRCTRASTPRRSPRSTTSSTAAPSTAAGPTPSSPLVCPCARPAGSAPMASNSIWNTPTRAPAAGWSPKPWCWPPATASARSTGCSAPSTPMCGATPPGGRRSTPGTVSSSTRRSPGMSTCRTPNATPTASAHPTWAWPPGGPPSCSTT